MEGELNRRSAPKPHVRADICCGCAHLRQTAKRAPKCSVCGECC